MNYGTLCPDLLQHIWIFCNQKDFNAFDMINKHWYIANRSRFPYKFLDGNSFITLLKTSLTKYIFANWNKFQRITAVEINLDDLNRYYFDDENTLKKLFIPIDKIVTALPIWTNVQTIIFNLSYWNDDEVFTAMKLNRLSNINEIIWRADKYSDTASIEWLPLHTFTNLKYLHVIEPNLDDFNTILQTCRNIKKLIGLAIDTVEVDISAQPTHLVKIQSLHTKTADVVRVFSDYLQELCFTFVGSTCNDFMDILCDTKLDMRIQKMFLDISSVDTQWLSGLFTKVLTTQKQLISLKIYCVSAQIGSISTLLRNQAQSTVAVTIYSNQKYASMFTFDGRLGGFKYQSDWLMQCHQCKQIL
eukprot:18065_1